MITENEISDKDEIFQQLLLVGGLFAPHSTDENNGRLGEMLKISGITLNQSDFQVLDRCTLGSSSVLIVKYMLDYTVGEDPAAKRICVEGSVASEVDFRGNIHIRILSKPIPPYQDFETAQREYSPVKINP